MKKFLKVLLIAVFAILIAGSTQSIFADHLRFDGKGIFTDQNDVNLTNTEDSKYRLHLQVVVRDAEGGLVSVLESFTGKYLQNELIDYIFDQKLGEKEIVSIDNIKYEKVRITHTPTLNQRLVGLYPILSDVPLELNIQTSKEEQEWLASWKIHYCADFEEHKFQCIPVFQTNAPTASLAMNDIVVNQWTVLREIG